MTLLVLHFNSQHVLQAQNVHFEACWLSVGISGNLTLLCIDLTFIYKSTLFIEFTDKQAFKNTTGVDNGNKLYAVQYYCKSI